MVYVRGLREERSSTPPLPTAINWQPLLCHGWDFAPPLSTSVFVWQLCTGLGHPVKASWVPMCPAVSGKRQSLLIIPHLHVCQSFCPLVCREPWALVGEGCGVAVSFTGWAFCSLIICILTMHGSLLTFTYCKKMRMRMGGCAKSTGRMILGQFNIISALSRIIKYV